MKSQNVLFEDLTSDSPLSIGNIYAVSIAECGAQGPSGEVTVYSVENGKIIVRGNNYCYGDYDIEILAELLLPIQILNFYDNPHGNEQWHYDNMTGGNHLWVKNSIYPELRNTVNHPPGIINKVISKLHWYPMRLYLYHEGCIVDVLMEKMKRGQI